MLQCEDNVVVGSWWQVDLVLTCRAGPAWWLSPPPQSQSKHATGLNRAEGEMAVKALYWTILLLSWLNPAVSESIMDYLRNREDLSQVSWDTFITEQSSVFSSHLNHFPTKQMKYSAQL